MKLRGMFDQPGDCVTQTEFRRTVDALSRRIDMLERRIADLGAMRTLADSGQQSYAWGQGQGEKYYHRPDLSSTFNQAGPWVTNVARVLLDFRGNTPRDIALVGLSGPALTAIADIIAPGHPFPIQTYAAMFCVSIVLATGATVVDDRLIRHKAISAEEKKTRRRRSELEVTATLEQKGSDPLMLIFDVPGIEAYQMIEFAEYALNPLHSLAVNAVAGGSKVFSQIQYQHFRSKLISAGLFTNTRPSKLTRSGHAVFQRLLERSKQ